MNIADLIDALQDELCGFDLYENMGGCAISALYFAKHLSRLKVKHKIIYWSDGDSSGNDCEHCHVRIPLDGVYYYLDSNGVHDFEDAKVWGTKEKVKAKKDVRWEVANWGWNDTYDRSNNAELRARIDDVFESIRV